MSLCGGIHGKHHDAGGVEVEPVHQQRLRKFGFYPGLQAIGVMAGFAGHAQQSGRLIHKQQMLILMQDLQAGVRRR